MLIAHANKDIINEVQFNESWSPRDILLPEASNSTVLVHSETLIVLFDIPAQVPKDSWLFGRGRLTDKARVSKTNPKGEGVPLEGYSVNITWDDSVVKIKTTDVNGNFSFNFQVIGDIGTHELEIIFDGAEYLAMTNISSFIDVQTDVTGIYIEIEPSNSVMIGDTIQVSGEIYAEIETTYPLEGEMDIKVYSDFTNDILVNTVSLENATYFADVYLDPLELHASDYKVIAIYKGSRYFSQDTSDAINITIKGIGYFFVESIDVNRGSDRQIISAWLRENTGDGLGGMKVYVSYNISGFEFPYSYITASDGKFSFPFQAGMTDPLGIVQINLTYEGTLRYQGANHTVNFFITSATKIEIISYQSTLIRNDAFLIEGRVSDDQEIDVIGGKIEVKIGPTSIGFTLTDSNGKFSLTYVVPKVAPLGFSTIQVKLIGDERYANSTAIVTVEVFAEPIMLIQARGTGEDTRIVKGEEFLVEVTLTEDNTIIPVEGALVVVKIDGVEQPPKITNFTGKIFFTITFPKNSDRVVVNADYLGSETEYYLSASEEKVVVPSRDVSEDDESFAGAVGSFWIIILGIIILMFVVGIWLRWRRKHVEELKQIITELVYELETKDKIRKAIFTAYIKMLNVLQTYGFIRKKNETPYEFERAVKKALPRVNRKYLKNLTQLFVEARYSDHKLTKKERKRALRNLKQIQRSLAKSDLEPVVEKRSMFKLQRPAAES